ncbi:MAG: hypothetical protein LBI39_02610 [Puniceicoccales bacterium]|nr:hypothetical protein [Puniceicoccales bacterium]
MPFSTPSQSRGIGTIGKVQHRFALSLRGVSSTDAAKACATVKLDPAEICSKFTSVEILKILLLALLTAGLGVLVVVAYAAVQRNNQDSTIGKLCAAAEQVKSAGSGAVESVENPQKLADDETHQEPIRQPEQSEQSQEEIASTKAEDANGPGSSQSIAAEPSSAQSAPPPLFPSSFQQTFPSLSPQASGGMIAQQTPPAASQQSQQHTGGPSASGAPGSVVGRQKPGGGGDNARPDFSVLNAWDWDWAPPLSDISVANIDDPGNIDSKPTLLVDVGDDDDAPPEIGPKEHLVDDSAPPAGHTSPSKSDKSEGPEDIAVVDTKKPAPSNPEDQIPPKSEPDKPASGGAANEPKPAPVGDPDAAVKQQPPPQLAQSETPPPSQPPTSQQQVGKGQHNVPPSGGKPPAGRGPAPAHDKGSDQAKGRGGSKTGDSRRIVDQRNSKTGDRPPPIGRPPSEEPETPPHAGQKPPAPRLSKIPAANQPNEQEKSPSAAAAVRGQQNEESPTPPSGQPPQGQAEPAGAAKTPSLLGRLLSLTFGWH